MNRTYFVAPSLPPLALGEEPDHEFSEVMDRLALNLPEKELKKFTTLLLLCDLQNIRSLYAKEPLDPHGNLSEKELDEALLVKADLPEYVFAFLDQFEDIDRAMDHFFGLISRYYVEEIAKQKGFLQELLRFQREVRLVLLALRAKKANRDVMTELQYEDFSDPMVAHILAQKDMDVYEPPQEYQDLKRQIEEVGNDPWRQYQVVAEYEFQQIEEMSGYPLFSVDWVLGYVARLILVDKWNLLDWERGREIAIKYKTG